MIKNYFKIAWRNIGRQKGYSGINIVGLAIGIAACLLILQYVSFELSYENFQVNKDRIYRVRQDRYDNGKLSTQWVSGAYAVGNPFLSSEPLDEADIFPFNTSIGLKPDKTKAGYNPEKNTPTRNRLIRPSQKFVSLNKENVRC